MDRVAYEDLKRWKTDRRRKPLVLGGARQTGKTWLLRHFGSSEFRSLLYINFESDPKAATIFTGELSPDSVVPALELYGGQSIDAERDLIIFDEIQLAPRALTSLKYFSEGDTRYAICAAGSLLGLSGSTSAYPVGKVTQRTLFPLCFREYLAAVEPRLHEYLIDWVTAPVEIPEFVHSRLLENLFRFFLVGGMPEAVGSYVDSAMLDERTVDTIRTVHSDLLIGYRSDFAKHSGQVNSHHLTRVMESVPAQLSRDVDGNAGRYVFKGVLPHSKRFRDVAGAIDWLTTTGLVHRVPVVQDGRAPLAAHVRESIFKLYLLDIGLLHSMLSVPPFDVVNQSWGAYRGYVAENFVATELRAHRHDSLYAWKGTSAEVEFILKIDGAVVPIEVKAGKNTRRAKSLQVFRDTYRPPVAVKVSTRNFAFDGAVAHVPLYATGFVADILRRL